MKKTLKTGALIAFGLTASLESAQAQGMQPVIAQVQSALLYVGETIPEKNLLRGGAIENSPIQRMTFNSLAGCYLAVRERQFEMLPFIPNLEAHYSAVYDMDMEDKVIPSTYIACLDMRTGKELRAIKP
jgi:hypothetical protein